MRSERVGRPTVCAIMLWTGGKDSCLSLHEVIERGFKIQCLVTFGPEGEESSFQAHPVSTMKKQAEAIGFQHEMIAIRAPYRESYIVALVNPKILPAEFAGRSFEHQLLTDLPKGVDQRAHEEYWS